MIFSKKQKKSLKWCYTGRDRREWEHNILSFKEKLVALGTEAVEWNSTAADEVVESLAWGRLQVVCEFTGHVETIKHLHFDIRKIVALWLMTSNSIARDLDFETKETLEAKTKDICERLTWRSLLDDDWTRRKIADAPEWSGHPSGNLAAGSILRHHDEKKREHMLRGLRETCQVNEKTLIYEVSMVRSSCWMEPAT